MPLDDKELKQLFLQRLLSSDKVVVVEGKRDQEALRRIGFSGKTFVLNRKPLFAVAEEVASAYNEAIILTDLDKEGKQLYARLKTYLQRLGVSVDNYFREFLFKHTKLRQIEGLASVVQSVMPSLLW